MFTCMCAIVSVCVRVCVPSSFFSRCIVTQLTAHVVVVLVHALVFTLCEIEESSEKLLLCDYWSRGIS
jgi:hypothetical protein